MRRKYSEDTYHWKLLASFIITTAFEDHRRCKRGLKEHCRSCSFFKTIGVRVLCDFLKADANRIIRKLEQECKYVRNPTIPAARQTHQQPVQAHPGVTLRLRAKGTQGSRRRAADR